MKIASLVASCVWRCYRCCFFYRLIFPPGAVFLVGSSVSWSCRWSISATLENCRTSSIYKSSPIRSNWQFFEKIEVSFSSAFASQKIWPFFLATATRWNGAHGPSEWSVRRVESHGRLQHGWPRWMAENACVTQTRRRVDKTGHFWAFSIILYHFAILFWLFFLPYFFVLCFGMFSSPAPGLSIQPLFWVSQALETQNLRLKNEISANWQPTGSEVHGDLDSLQQRSFFACHPHGPASQIWWICLCRRHRVWQNQIDIHRIESIESMDRVCGSSL